MNIQRIKNYIFGLIFLSCISLFSDPISWEASSTLSSSGVNASEAQIQMDSSCNNVAIWLEGTALVAATQLLGQSWSSITTIVASGVSEPRLVVDPSGNATALWLEGSTLNTSTKRFGGSWSAAETLSSSASEPQIAVRSNGDVTAVWVEATIILASIKTFGGAWPGKADRLSSSGADTPQVAIGNEGTVVAVWHNVVATLDTILSATTTIGSPWDSEVTISSSDSSINPAVAVDVDGDAIGSWFTFSQSGTSFTNVFVNVAAKAKGDAWQTSVAISDSGFYDPSELQILLIFDTDKDAIALWRTSLDGSNFYVQASIKGVSETIWGAVATFFINPNSLAIDLSSPNSKDAMIICMENTSSTINIQSSIAVINNAITTFWQASDPINDTYNNNAFPKISSGLDSNTVHATALWIAYDGTNDVLRTSDGSRTDVLPPTNVSVVQSVQDFDLFTETINTLTWTASLSSGIRGYFVFRDNLTIGQTSSTILTFIDHNRSSGESWTYGVAALSSDNRESATATTTIP